MALDPGKRFFSLQAPCFYGALSDPLLATPLSMGQGVHEDKGTRPHRVYDIPPLYELCTQYLETRIP